MGAAVDRKMLASDMAGRTGKQEAPPFYHFLAF